MAESDRIVRVAVHRPPRGPVVAVAVLLILGGVACSNDDLAAPSTTTTTEANRTLTTTLTTTTTTGSTTASEPTASSSSSSAPAGQTVEDEIIARYIGYWDARLAANSGTPNPDDPALRDYATGAQLDAVVAETRTYLEQGLALRHAENPVDLQQIHVIEVDGDRAVVQECVVDDLVVVRRDSGDVVNDAVATHNVRGELLRVDGVWRVSEARLVQRWEGVAGCAPAR